MGSPKRLHLKDAIWDGKAFYHHHIEMWKYYAMEELRGALYEKGMMIMPDEVRRDICPDVQRAEGEGMP